MRGLGVECRQLPWNATSLDVERGADAPHHARAAGVGERLIFTHYLARDIPNGRQCLDERVQVEVVVLPLEGGSPAVWQVDEYDVEVRTPRLEKRQRSG